MSSPVLEPSLISSIAASDSFNESSEDVSTVTGPRSPTKPYQNVPLEYVKLAKCCPFNRLNDSSSEIRLLAASAQITEVSYSVSDIHTRIFGMLSFSYWGC